MPVGSWAFLSAAMPSHAVPHPSSHQPPAIPLCALQQAPADPQNKQGQRTNPGQQQPLQKQGPSGSVQHFIEQ